MAVGAIRGFLGVKMSFSLQKALLQQATSNFVPWREGTKSDVAKEVFCFQA
jgi:hypothetical protein